MRNEQKFCRCQTLTSNIVLGPFARDEKLDRVERILEIMMESRSPGFYYERLDPQFSFACEAEVNYDLMPSGSAPNSFEAGSKPIGMGSSHTQTSDLRPNWLASVAAFQSHALSPPSLARGSPYPPPPVTYPRT